jgi:hypothetical protein
MKLGVYLIIVLTPVLTACGGAGGGFDVQQARSPVLQSVFVNPATDPNPCDRLVIMASSGTIHPGQRDALAVFVRHQNFSGFECRGPVTYQSVTGRWTSNGGHLDPLVGHTTNFGAHRLGSYAVEVRQAFYKEPGTITIVVN